MHMGVQEIDKRNYKFNNKFKKYKVTLVVKEYFEVVKTNFSCMKMGVQGKYKLNNIIENQRWYLLWDNILKLPKQSSMRYFRPLLK